MDFEKIQSITGFRELLILDPAGEIEYRYSSKSDGVPPEILSGYLASAFAISENTSLSFIGSSLELAFDGGDGSILVMHDVNHYFFLVLDGTPSMGIARLKLRELVDHYEP